MQLPLHHSESCRLSSQEVSDDKDREYCEQLNEFVNNPQAAAQAAAGGGGDDDSTAGTASGGGGAGGSGVDPQFLQQLFPGFGFGTGGGADSRPSSAASAASAASSSAQGAVRGSPMLGVYVSLVLTSCTTVGPLHASTFC